MPLESLVRRLGITAEAALLLAVSQDSRAAEPAAHPAVGQQTEYREEHEDRGVGVDLGPRGTRPSEHGGHSDSHRAGSRLAGSAASNRLRAEKAINPSAGPAASSFTSKRAPYASTCPSFTRAGGPSTCS